MKRAKKATLYMCLLLRWKMTKKSQFHILYLIIVIKVTVEGLWTLEPSQVFSIKV